MQVYDNQNQIVVSEGIDLLHVPDRLGELIKRVDVKKVVVAPLPKEGDELEHNGLKFVVTREMGRNRYIIKLVTPVSVTTKEIR